LKNTKVLVLGATGMAGHLIYEGLKEMPQFDVVGTTRKLSADASEGIYFDALEIDTYASFFKKNNSFDIIINCIGLLVNDCESDVYAAFTVNMCFPKVLEKHFETSETKIIHLSTDCVFNGKKGGYLEDDRPDDLSMYGVSKAQGELDNEKDLTIRTSIIGPDIKSEGVGLFNWFMSIPKNGEIFGYKKAIWSGITTTELLKVIVWSIDEEIGGLYQVASSPISKHDMLCELNRVFEKGAKILPENDYEVDKSLIDSRQEYQLSGNFHQMCQSMRQWIASHPKLYPNYLRKVKG